MVLQHRSRSTGCWNDQQYQTRKTNFCQKKRSKNGTLTIAVVFILCSLNFFKDIHASTTPAQNNKTLASSLASLYSSCNNGKNQTHHIIDIVENMHFNFCEDIHPAFFIPQTLTNSSSVELTIESNFGNVSFRVPDILRCDAIFKLLNLDTEFSNIDADFGLTLDRLDDCTLQKKIDCERCKVRIIFCCLQIDIRYQ